MNTSNEFFSSGPFMPHGHCYYWSKDLIALHAISDALIVAAYYSIPLTLLYFVRRRHDLTFHWMFVCFAVFILACGTTHLVEIWNIWHADYWLSGGVKALTALASVPTAFLLIKLVPIALALPSADALQKARDELELRVAERTRQLAEANATLTREARERQRAEQEARDSELLLRAVLDSAISAVVVIDRTGRIIDWNARAEKMFGWPRAEILGQELAGTIIPPRYRTAHQRGLERYLATGEGLVLNRIVELSALRRDGSEFPVELSISPLQARDTLTFCGFITDITERKQAEAAVRSSQHLLQAIIDNATAVIYVKDLEGRYLLLNRRYEELFHVDRANLAGKTDFDVFPTEAAEAFRSFDRKVLAAGKALEAEEIAPHADGPHTYLSVKCPLFDADGRPYAVCGISTDITERKQAAERLQASLKDVNDLKAALDEHAIVAITNPQGRITYVNDKFCAISKYSRHELLGQDHRIINSGHHPKEFIRDLWTTIARGQVWKGEIQNRAKDGSIYWVDTTIVPFLKPDGKPYQYVAIRADITERKRSEAHLRASLKDINDLKSALDEHAIVAITTPQGRITYVNDKFCAISKYSREELLGQDHRIINSGHHSKEFIRDLWTTIAQGRVWKGEIKNRAKDGSVYWVDTTIVPFLKPDGKPYQYVAIRADVTQRKLIEEEIRRLNQELESRVDERTAQLEAANKELEAFSYSVSHDLRAPLRHIDGFAGLLVKAERQNVTERGRGYLANIADSAKQMGRLIDDLLVFSRMGRADMRIDRVDLSVLVEETIRSLQPEIQQRQILWRKAPLPVVQADPPMLRQVFVNLLANAVKYSGPRNPAVIEIGCRQDTPDGLIVFVRDNGVGFEMRYADKLFGVFQRLHRAEDFEGTGIGLANVRRIVNRHGGRTWAEGEPGVGATFYFTLPKSRNPSS